MRRLIFVVALGIAAGCGSDPKKPDDGNAAKPAPKPQPKPQPAPQPAPKPADPPSDDTPIVIKGSHRKDTAPTTNTGSDPERDARIRKLEEQAKTSQGKDNGTAIKDSTGPDAPKDPKDAQAAKKARIQAQIDDTDAKIKALQDDRSQIVHKQRTRHGNEETIDDPEKLKQIDAQIDDLKSKRVALQKALIDIDLETPPPGAPK